MPTEFAPSSGRGRRAHAAGLTLLAATSLAACGSPSSTPAAHRSTYGAPAAGAASRPSSAGAPDSQVAHVVAATASRTYRTQMGALSLRFVDTVAAIGPDVTAGNLAGARTAELTAQAEYDALREIVSVDPTTADALDELPGDEAPGTPLAGLQAVARDLWASPVATGAVTTDLTSLVAQARAGSIQVSNALVAPEAMGSDAVSELGWVVDVPLAGRGEPFTDRDLVDVAAGVDAVDQVVGDLTPLGRLVDPTRTADVTTDVHQLTDAVAALGPPTTTGDAVLLSDERALTVRIDATAAVLAQLASELTPFGTSGGGS